MNKHLFSILSFERLWLFMPLVFFFLYIPQAVVGIFIFRDALAFELAGVMLLGLSTYLLIYFWMSKLKNSKCPSLAKLALGERLSSHYVIMTILVCYFMVIAYALLTSEKVALWEALSGASASDIAYAREELFKRRVGWEKILPYANSIFSSALMPFAVAICYIERKTYRHQLLMVFAFSLLPSMEKVLILKALLPLVILGLNGYLPWRRMVQIIVITSVVITTAFFFSKMGAIDPKTEINKVSEQLQFHQARLDSLAQDAQEKMAVLLPKVRPYYKEESRQANAERLLVQSQIEFYGSRLPKQIQYEKEALRVQMDSLRVEESKLGKYYVFGSGRLMFILNRILWIPYVTAYDWLGYFYEKLEGKYLFGKTSFLIARITGEVKFPMEREVFKYQFGESGPQTASANASFLVDAFVNFGWIGVVIYASLFAALTWVVVVQANPATQACYYYFALQASMGGLSGVLFSNGMLLLILLAFFVRPKSNVVTY